MRVSSWINLGRRWFGSSPSGRRRQLTRARLLLEPLEARELLTGTWTPLVNQAPDPAGISDVLLLSDGTVMAQGANGLSNAWYRLTPDAKGNYADGTWSTLASMNVGRLDYTKELLPNGDAFVIGGEAATDANETSSAEIYNPLTNTWSLITSFPGGTFGDGPSETLAGGRVLASSEGSATGQTYIYHPATATWTETGSKLWGDSNSEETWVKLPDGSILTYDMWAGPKGSNGTDPQVAQRYVPSLGKWLPAGKVPVSLAAAPPAWNTEIGAGVLMPNGRVFYIGATGNTAIYTPPTTLKGTGTWAAGPTLPDGLVSYDAPAAVETNGKVLFAAGPNTTAFRSSGPTTYFEYDPRTNSLAKVTSTGPTQFSPFALYMLDLPNGQILETTSTDQLWVYAPDSGPRAAWRPTVSSIRNDGHGVYTLTGTQLNGLTEGATEGDDEEMATNYPLIQLNDSAGNVYYARTFDWSSTGVATGKAVETVNFTLPADLPAGTFKLHVVANGIPSSATTFRHLALTADNSGLSAFAATGSGSADSASAADGYWLVSATGQVYGFGAKTYGSAPDLQGSVVGIAAAPHGDGYWLATNNGAVYAFGPGAHYEGDLVHEHLSSPIVAIAADPATGGYYLVSGDGGVFAFHAPNLGGAAGQHVTGMAVTPSGHGYWLVFANGGVRRFGDAHFYGSTAADHLKSPIVSIAATADGKGYTLMSASGQIFVFGDAHRYGSLSSGSAAGFAAGPHGGYWITTTAGEVEGFHVPFEGALPSDSKVRIVGIASPV